MLSNALCEQSPENQLALRSLGQRSPWTKAANQTTGVQPVRQQRHTRGAQPNACSWSNQHICRIMDTVPSVSGDVRQLRSDASRACLTPARTSSVWCVSIHNEYWAAVRPERSCGAWTSAGSLQGTAQGPTHCCPHRDAHAHASIRKEGMAGLMRFSRQATCWRR